MNQSDEYWNSLLGEVFGNVSSEIHKFAMEDCRPEKSRAKQVKQIEDFVGSCENRKLVLVLGSGVSSNFGLPRWNELLNCLLPKVWSEGFHCDPSDTKLLTESLTDSTPNPVVTARFIRHLAKERFSETVRNQLYLQLKQDEKSISWLSEITVLCQSKRVDSIITYNFDDVLEQHLAENKVNFTSIYEHNANLISGSLPIYHVHGLLQQHFQATEDTHIIFSEEDYHEQYHEPYNWNTLIQLDKYRTMPCLFVGTSLTDPNQRRLLEVSKKYRVDDSLKHYNFRKRIAVTESTERMRCFMEYFYTQVDADFGINTIWVDEYDEIPSILREITERLSKPTKI
jgi:hypothetical protein